MSVFLSTYLQTASQKLEQVDKAMQRRSLSIFLIECLSKAQPSHQEIQRGLMSIFRTKYFLKLKGVDQEIQGLMSIFLVKYLFKASGSRPGDPERNYELSLLNYLLLA